MDRRKSPADGSKGPRASADGSPPEPPAVILRQIQADTRMTVILLQAIYNALLHLNKRGDRMAGEILDVLAEAREGTDP